MSMSQAMHVLTSNAMDEWYTPSWIIELVREALGAIDFDPASSEIAQRTVKATRYDTAETVLHTPWAGRVFLNPPFSDTSGWVQRLNTAYDSGSVTAAILLVNSAPGYGWFEKLWRRQPVCMLRERLSFLTPSGAVVGQAKKGQCLAYYGPDVARFAAVFGPYGRIIPPEESTQ